MNDELRGSTPIYTAKDILIRVESKVDALDSKVDNLHTSVEILTSQELATRISRLESWQQQLSGMAIVVKALLGTSLIGLVLSVAGILKAFGMI
jgi:hypothetical protein